MYERLRSLGLALPKRAGRLLSISHSENLAELMGITPTEIIRANYPEHSLLSLNFADSSFDFVVSDQVLEHVEGDPQAAIDECHRVLRTGGVAIHTTCFMNPFHGAPKDFWRFTPDALALLHKDWSKTIEASGWGNLQVWSVVQDGMRFVGVPHAAWHPFHKIAVRNDPEWHLVVWVVAVK